MPFFDLPKEVRSQIYCNINTPDELFSAWKTSKQEQRLIEQVLFSKDDAAFYPLQVEVLTKLCYALRNTIESAYLQQLATKFFTKLNNPRLGLREKLHNLKLLGVIHGTPLDITSILFSQSSNEQNAMINCLDNIAPALRQQEVQCLFDWIENKIKEKNSDADYLALRCLTVIAPVLKTLNKEASVNIVQWLQGCLKDNDIDLPPAASRCLTALIPLLEQNEQLSILKWAQKQSGDYKSNEDELSGLDYESSEDEPSDLDYESSEDEPSDLDYESSEDEPSDLDYESSEDEPVDVNYALTKQILPLQSSIRPSIDVVALVCLTALAPVIQGYDKKQQFDVLKLVMAKITYGDMQINYYDKHVHNSALDCLTTLTPVFQEEIQINVLQWAKEQLTETSVDSEEYIKKTQTALNCLAALVSIFQGLETEKKQNLLNLIQKKTTSQNSGITQTAFSCLVALQSNSDSAIKEKMQCLFLDYFEGKLADEKLNTRLEILNLITTLAPAFETAAQITIAQWVKNCLTEEDLYQAALRCLVVLAPASALTLEKEVQRQMLEWVMTFEKDYRFNKALAIHQAASDCLVSLFPTLEPEEKARVLELIKEQLFNGRPRISQNAWNLFISALIDSDCKNIVKTTLSSQNNSLQVISNWIQQFHQPETESQLTFSGAIRQ